MSAVRKTGNLQIPPHLKNAPTEWLKSQGNAAGYQYPHESGNKGDGIPSEDLPIKRFYIPSNVGTETKFLNIAELLQVD